MLYATCQDTGQRIPAIPNTMATCLICGFPVRSKCGQINVWHWAHISTGDCDPWAEPDSHWHQAWQMRFPEGQREVVIGRHRADVATSHGVVEIQHSSISVDEICEREAFYGSMVWIFDARAAFEEHRLDLRRKPNRTPEWRSFRWKHPRKSLVACNRTVFLHLTAGWMLRLGAIYSEAPCGGWGHLMTEDEVIALLTRP